MRRSYRKGLGLALRQWRVVLLVFGASFLGGCLFMVCAWVWLASALDSSLATRTLSTSIDANVFIDLAHNHAGSLRTFLFLALVLTACGSVVWVAINAVVLAMVSGRQSLIGEAARAGLERYFAFLKLWATAMTANAAAIGGAYLGGRLLLRWTAASSSAMTSYGIMAASFILGLAAVLVIATIHDHARIRALETGDAAVWSGLWACSYVVRERRALPLAAILACTTLVGWVAYQTAGAMVATDSALGLSISMIAAQAFMAFRALVRVWAFAAATDLQSGWESA